MRNNIFGLVTAFVLIGACASCFPPKPVEEVKKEVQPENIIVGGQKDEYGCPITAGYTWSLSRKSCVRIWEVGTKFEDLRDAKSSMAIFVIENGADGAMEIYLPESAKPLLLEKKANFWLSDNGEFRIEKRNNGELNIFSSGRLIAKGVSKP